MHAWCLKFGWGRDASPREAGRLASVAPGGRGFGRSSEAAKCLLADPVKSPQYDGHDWYRRTGETYKNNRRTSVVSAGTPRAERSHPKSHPLLAASFALSCCPPFGRDTLYQWLPSSFALLPAEDSLAVKCHCVTFWLLPERDGQGVCAHGTVATVEGAVVTDLSWQDPVDVRQSGASEVAIVVGGGGTCARWNLNREGGRVRAERGLRNEASGGRAPSPTAVPFNLPAHFLPDLPPLHGAPVMSPRSIV